VSIRISSSSGERNIRKFDCRTPSDSEAGVAVMREQGFVSCLEIDPGKFLDIHANVEIQLQTHVIDAPTGVISVVKARLSKLEMQIMETLWTKGEASIREMQDAFPAKKRPG
jgi:hypothetical protein